MSNLNHFEKNFDYGSFLPLFLFISGFYTIFNIINNNFPIAFFSLLVSFIIYVGNNIYINYTKITTVFNEYLEDMASFIAFGVSIVIFGLVFYKNDNFILMIVLFYSICLILSMARNWVMKLKNSVGFPIALNGLFFPIFYYVYKFYLQELGSSIFIFYFILVGFLTISNYNFLGYSEDGVSRFNIIDLIDLKRKEKKESEKEKLDKIQDNNVNNNNNIDENKDNRLKEEPDKRDSNLENIQNKNEKSNETRINDIILNLQNRKRI